jgi:hypothetical protein
MVGSRSAAEIGDKGLAATTGGRGPRVLFATLLLGLMVGACSTPPPQDAPRLTAATPIQPVTTRHPILPALTGLSAAEVVGLFGEPDFRRGEAPAELWQYRSADCVLDLFLYRDLSGTHVVHTETRDRNQLQAGHCRDAASFARAMRESRL